MDLKWICPWCDVGNRGAPPNHECEVDDLKAVIGDLKERVVDLERELVVAGATMAAAGAVMIAAADEPERLKEQLAELDRENARLRQFIRQPPCPLEPESDALPCFAATPKASKEGPKS